MRPMEDALTAARVPWQTAGGTGLLGREVVMDAVAYLQLAVHPQNDLDFQRICNKPSRGMGTH